MKLNYKARVVHDVAGNAYNVEYKRNWYSRWKWHQSIGYDLVDGWKYHYRQQPAALEKAKESADGLVNEAVVYSVPNNEPICLFD